MYELAQFWLPVDDMKYLSIPLLIIVEKAPNIYHQINFLRNSHFQLEKYTIRPNATMSGEPVHGPNITNEINRKVNPKYYSLSTKITPNSEGTASPKPVFS